MKTILSSRRHHYLADVSIFLATLVLIAGMAGCGELPCEDLKIQTWYDLDAVRNCLTGNHILLTDLDSDTPGYIELASPTANAGKGWQPIGTEENAFKGTFAGNAHSISDLFIDRPDEDDVGLFGRVEEGILMDVGLVSVNVTGKKFVGALVGYNWKGTLDSDTRLPSMTYSHGSVTGEEDVGGLVGHNALIPEGRVEDCGGAYSVHGNLAVGGVAGRSLGTLRRSSFTGEVNGIPTGEGRIALNEAATGNAYFSDAALPGSYVGGVVGVNEGTVEECSAEATVEGYQCVGGLAGANNGTVESCSSDSKVTGTSNVGGLVGENKGNVGSCSSSGNVTGDSHVGCLVGYNTGTVSNPESTSCVTGTSDCGPLVGTNEGVISIPMQLKNPGSFVQMTIGDVDSFDPAWGYDTASGEQVRYIYEALLFYDGEETDQFVPILATEWELLDDNVTYRFKIRESVKFHNGNDLTPEDVEYSFERAMVQNRIGGPIWMFYQSLLGAWGCAYDYGDIEFTFADINNAVEIDGDWVQFNLSDPAWGLAFLQILCGPWGSIVDKEWCVVNGDWDGTEETWQDYNNPDVSDSYLYNHTNGTGPWKLEEWDPGVRIKLVGNDDYWRESVAFEMVITQIVEEWTTRKAALLAGDADFVYVPRANIGELEAIADLNVYQALPELLLSIDAFLFNFNINSDSEFIGSGALDGSGIPTDFFTDLNVRKGFNYAFDWETYINDALMGEAEQRGSPVCEGLPYFNPDASMYSFDLAKAEEHLKVAWDGELWDKGCNFTLLYNPGNLPRETACRILAENLAGINPKFQVSIQPTAWGTYLDKMWGTRDMPMFQIGWIADYPHPNNLVIAFMASYGYSELDELIKSAFKELDPAVQEGLYYEIQERYYEDAPSIMLVQPLGRRYFTKYIHGFYFNPFILGQAGPLYYMTKSES